MKKGVWFKIHWIIGLLLGFILTIIGFTGAALSFQNEILNLLNRDIVYTKGNGSRLPVEKLLEKAQHTFPDSRLNSLTLSINENGSPKINVLVNPANFRGETYYIDGITGEVKREGLAGKKFFDAMFSLHRWLGSRPGSVGQQVVAIATICAIFLSLTGLVLYLPQLRRRFKDSLKIDFNKSGYAFLYKLHAVLGVWSFIFILIMSFTGLFWSYGWYRNMLFKIAGVTPGARPHTAGEGDKPQPLTYADYLNASRAYELFKNEVGGAYSSVTVTLPKAGAALFDLSYRSSNPEHSRAVNNIAIDTAEGRVVKHAKYADKSAGEKFMASIYPLHSGDFFGIAGMVIYFLSSLAMSLFGVTGYMQYYKRAWGKLKSVV